MDEPTSYSGPSDAWVAVGLRESNRTLATMVEELEAKLSDETDLNAELTARIGELRDQLARYDQTAGEILQVIAKRPMLFDQNNLLMITLSALREEK